MTRVRTLHDLERNSAMRGITLRISMTVSNDEWMVLDNKSGFVYYHPSLEQAIEGFFLRYDAFIKNKRTAV